MTTPSLCSEQTTTFGNPSERWLSASRSRGRRSRSLPRHCLVSDMTAYHARMGPADAIGVRWVQGRIHPVKWRHGEHQETLRSLQKCTSNASHGFPALFATVGRWPSPLHRSERSLSAHIWRGKSSRKGLRSEMIATFPDEENERDIGEPGRYINQSPGEKVRRK